jgi:hypothetical protein
MVHIRRIAHFPIYSYRRIADFLGIMTETTVELIFGTKAGIVWKALNQNGPSNIGDLVKATSLSREEVNGALGWLGREDKITVEKRGRALVFSLHEAELRSATIESTPVEDSVPKKQGRSKASMPPKKTKKARKVKDQVKQTENPASKK